MYHKYKSADARIKVNNEEINKYINICNGDPVYTLNKDSLDDLFVKYPNNSTNINKIGIRVKSITLNECYSTRIKSIDLVKLPDWICNIPNIDKRITSGDFSVVNEIAASKSVGGVTTQDVYSFASKYCHFHNPDAYPIFDSYVSDMLCQLQKEEDFYRKQLGVNKKFTQTDLKDYSKFNEVRQAFVNYYNLNHYSILDIDKFLWRAGKDTYFK